MYPTIGATGAGAASAGTLAFTGAGLTWTLIAFATVFAVVGALMRLAPVFAARRR
jgi:hypothetical protein